MIVALDVDHVEATLVRLNKLGFTVLAFRKDRHVNERLLAVLCCHGCLRQTAAISALEILEIDSKAWIHLLSLYLVLK